MEPEKLYWPGQDYPDRQKWLDKRETPKGVHASQFYNPRKVVLGDLFNGVQQGRYNPGVNKLKELAKTNPEARKQLMALRRKVQQQGHVTIDKQLYEEKRS